MQILLNLLSNAVKFTKAGGSVRIECAGEAGRIMIRVQDTGIGIPASKIAYITRPFEQVSSSYTANGEGGTGLGLAITKDLIEMHGGSLVIESTEGQGTTVTAYMPPAARPPVKKTGRPDA
jgi:signal transduction histidine kinase